MLRFAALASLLAFANLSFVRGEWSCPQHESGSAGQPSQPESSAHHRGHDDRQDDTTPSDRGPQPDCCQVMITCAGAALLQSPGVAYIAELPATAQFTLSSSLFVSRIESPDPPPPKA